MHACYPSTHSRAFGFKPITQKVDSNAAGRADRERSPARVRSPGRYFAQRFLSTLVASNSQRVRLKSNYTKSGWQSCGTPKWVKGCWHRYLCGQVPNKLKENDKSSGLTGATVHIRNSINCYRMPLAAQHKTPLPSPTPRSIAETRKPLTFWMPCHFPLAFLDCFVFYTTFVWLSGTQPVDVGTPSDSSVIETKAHFLNNYVARAAP